MLLITHERIAVQEKYAAENLQWLYPTEAHNCEMVCFIELVNHTHHSLDKKMKLWLAHEQQFPAEELVKLICSLRETK